MVYSFLIGNLSMFLFLTGANLRSLALLIWLPVVVVGQYQIDSWTTDRGLPQNTVYSIAQTPDGYLWLTTLDGLVRFDGVNFTTFNKSNSKGIESNRFTAVLIDGAGDLWAGTETDYVTRYHQGHFTTFRFAQNEKSSSIRRLFLNPNGEVLVSTEIEIFRWNGDGFSVYDRVAGEKPEDLFLWAKDGTFWYSHGQIISCVKDNKVTEFRLPEVKVNTLITRILEDRNGRVWIGTQNAGLLFFRDEKIEHYLPKISVPEEMSPNIEDNDGNIWAGPVIISPGGEAVRLTTAQGLSEDSVTAVFQDREGNIWIGTTHRGLNRVNKQIVKFYSMADGLTGVGISPIFQDRSDAIWIGGGSLTKYSFGKFEAVPGREKFSQAVTAISQDSSGRIWFGSWGGGYYLENGQFVDFSQKFAYRTAVFDIHETPDGTIWFAARDGLYSYQNREMKHLTVADGIAGNDCKVIHESGDGTLWVGAYGGLTRIRDGVITSFTKRDGLAGDLVRSLYEDGDKTLWIGSYDGGLTRLKDGKFTRYTRNEGLFNDGVFQILEDESGNLWMSCNLGIYRVAKHQLNDFADGRVSHIESVAYGKADGMLEAECNGGQQPAGIKARDGHLWFPTQGGVAVVKPDSIKINPFAPPVIIESAKIDNETTAPADVIEVEPGKNNLEITYTGLSFRKPEFVKFKYKLVGQNSGWIEAGSRRTAYYSYLPPGQYMFQVIAANSDGVWNTDGARIKVVVRPPFYRTWWFFVLSLFLLTTAVYLLYRRRLAKVEHARRQQEDFSRKLLISQESERQRIAAELHDSIGQSLLIIKNRAFMALTDLDEPETVREQLEELSQSAAGAIEECREISYNLRPYQIHRFGLTKTLGAIFGRISEVMRIETAVQLDNIDDLFSDEAETNIYRIVQESVNNIIKHSEATEADLKITRSGSEVSISIHDNGCGFDNNKISGITPNREGFGLIGMNERVRMVSGVYEIQSSPGNGTNIRIKLKVSRINERN